MHDITVEEAIQSKRALEDSILALVRNFELHTTLTVTNVLLKQEPLTAIGRKEPKRFTVAVSVDAKL